MSFELSLSIYTVDIMSEAMSGVLQIKCELSQQLRAILNHCELSGLGPMYSCTLYSCTRVLEYIFWSTQMYSVLMYSWHDVLSTCTRVHS